MSSLLIRMVTRLKGVSRWHIERHILNLVAGPVNIEPLDHTRDWDIPYRRLFPGAICYCAGIGEDIDLELHIMRKYRVRVFAFDPTPRSKMFMESVAYDRSALTFCGVGLWSRDECLKFYAPDNPRHVSHSVVPGGCETRPFFEAPCRKLSTLMTEYDHENIDLLKMNIEGAEYAVLANMIEENIRPGVVMLTFEGSKALRRGLEQVAEMRRYGYELVGLNKWAASFVDNREHRGRRQMDRGGGQVKPEDE